ncbi:hypothetical protein LOTGIDRAFT_171390 [Lottia gigantea]|uniref:Uncharacterized protein n=1 Tax=Lottia gigantea TaxID=225164 RepID=V4B7B1_LOTGI|nr:hypothetical protein LOTGIDRAFT_171390 [Lottia gigantea]ESP03451.1 hypothetical protein LOTGIDRAFT_171390 [Lottia gigantea]
MANKFGLGSLSLETKKPNTTAWINKAKPYFVDQIGDTLQGDLDMNNFKVTNFKSPENDNDAVHKKYLREQINSIEVNKNHLEDKISNVKRFFKRQLNNKNFVNDTKLQQEITTINNLVLKQAKNIVSLEKKYLKEESYYFNLPFRNLSYEDLSNIKKNASITDNIDRSRENEYKKYGFTANIRVYKSSNSDFPHDMFDGKLPTYFVFNGKLQIEINFPIQVKVDSIFFKQISFSSKQFNARKVLQFINGRDNVEIKEYESNNENNKVNHLYEIKTSGKYIDRFRMLIIPDNEDQLGLRDFDMILETESPPSVSIIRNPETKKVEGRPISYQFLRATDFEYVKLYFANNSFIHRDGIISTANFFTSIDIHKSQEAENFIIFSSIIERNDGIEVRFTIRIYNENQNFQFI